MNASDASTMEALWSPTTLGSIHLAHRVAMAPMTRSRATGDGIVTQLTRTYYAQRASLSMLITEGTQPSADGQGYLATPGIHTGEQADAWRTVADAVHDAGSTLVVQLMHVGRVSHPSNTPHGRQALAPSAIAAAGDMFTASGPQAMPVPRKMTRADVAQTISDFRRAARLAVDAGADGVELHGANGYLLQQFLSTNANLRTDEYGGDIAGRIRFPIEVAAAVADEIGADRVGFRISPGSPLGDIEETDAAELYPALVAGLAPLRLAYLHVVHLGDDGLLRSLRDGWPTGLVLNRAGADMERRAQDVRDGLADVVSVGQLALANPDLIDRIVAGAPMNSPDRGTLYGGDERGYTDYPRLAA
ncbi:N-ethylmaleimide reductase [Agromyces hippuratus]|uniref:N-ethylmaleimide reductase n=1 Tax=Agromyces hippuratus TaxID=286438 RepID=A0A852X8B2_9MICO|nr:alkene reductase [Agromyces hippuratus]NYG22145.1 N-ethylmaleimide reductase [Agromyces hippuratus]